MKPNLFASPNKSAETATRSSSPKKSPSETKEIIFLSSGLLALLFGIGGLLMYSESETTSSPVAKQVQPVQIAKAFSTPADSSLPVEFERQGKSLSDDPKEAQPSFATIPQSVLPPQPHDTTIHFPLNGSTLSDEARERMAEHVAALPVDWKGTLRIEGHTDPQGTETYNQALGLKRAEAVQEFLLGQGIPEDRIQITSLGETSQICQEPEEECYRQNRRADLTFFPAPPIQRTDVANNPETFEEPTLPSLPSTDSEPKESSPTVELQEEMVALDPVAPSPSLP